MSYNLIVPGSREISELSSKALRAYGGAQGMGMARIIQSVKKLDIDLNKIVKPDYIDAEFEEMPPPFDVGDLSDLRLHYQPANPDKPNQTPTQSTLAATALAGIGALGTSVGNMVNNKLTERLFRATWNNTFLFGRQISIATDLSQPKSVRLAAWQNAERIVKQLDKNMSTLLRKANTDAFSPEVIERIHKLHARFFDKGGVADRFAEYAKRNRRFFDNDEKDFMASISDKLGGLRITWEKMRQKISSIANNIASFFLRRRV